MSNSSFQRFIVKVAAAALVTGTLAGPAMAEAVWRYPYKGTPYSVPHEHNEGVSSERKGPVSKPGHRHEQGSTQDKRTRESRGAAAKTSSVATPAVVLAHHKPGYHDGLPREGSPEDRSTA